MLSLLTTVLLAAAPPPLVPVPAECAVPPPAVVVFKGTVIDSVNTTTRFRIDRILAGEADGRSTGSIVDVRYGDETRFLEPGGRYVVGAGADEVSGALYSAVAEPAPAFGGDAVVGLDDSSVDCPRVEDPVRTLHADGTRIDTGVLSPLSGHGSEMLMAILWPLVGAFSVLLAVVAVKQAFVAIVSSAGKRPRRAPAGR
jgi:hypothetical protein